MKKLTAKDALKITTDADAYLDSLLELIFGEVKKQASQGLRWAHVNIDKNVEPSFLSKLKGELIILDYQLEGDQSATQFTIKW